MIRRLRLESICFPDPDSKDLCLTDFLLCNYTSSLPSEKHYALEDAFTPANSSFQGERFFMPKYNHFFSAPEMLPPINPLKDSRRYYGKQVDLWMLGCFIFNMITGVPPFFADNSKEEESLIFAKIRLNRQWHEKMLRYHKSASESLLSLLDACLNVDPQ